MTIPSPPPEENGSLADFNEDGEVDFSDFIDFASHYGLGEGDASYEAQFDLNNDGKVSFSDFVKFIEAYGNSST